MFSLTPTYQYKHPANGEIRPSDSKLDIGAYEYGTVVSGISETKKNILNFSVYPNPARETITISFPIIATNPILLQICDISGGVVLERKIPSGTEKTDITINEFRKGIYILKAIGINTCFATSVIIE